MADVKVTEDESQDLKSSLKHIEEVGKKVAERINAKADSRRDEKKR